MPSAAAFAAEHEALIKLCARSLRPAPASPISTASGAFTRACLQHEWPLPNHSWHCSAMYPAFICLQWQYTTRHQYRRHIRDCQAPSVRACMYACRRRRSWGPGSKCDLTRTAEQAGCLLGPLASCARPSGGRPAGELHSALHASACGARCCLAASGSGSVAFFSSLAADDPERRLIMSMLTLVSCLGY